MPIITFTIVLYTSSKQSIVEASVPCITLILLHNISSSTWIVLTVHVLVMMYMY